MVRRAWIAYLGVGALCALLYVAVPGPLRGSGPLFNLLGLSPILAIIVGVRLHRPASPAPWWIAAAGLVLFWLGDLYTYSYRVLSGPVPFPSLGDVFYVAFYPVLMVSLLLLVRRRDGGSDRRGLLDAGILSIGLALPQWTALIAPYLADEQASTLVKLVSSAYPVGDVLLLAVTVRLVLDHGRREMAFWLLASSMVLLLATDSLFGLMTLSGAFDRQLWLDLGWIGFYLLAGACALHPSMAGLAEPGPPRASVLTRSRLALLAVGALMAPALALLDAFKRGDLSMTVVQLVAVVLFVLVLTRMAVLVRDASVLTREIQRRRSEVHFESLVRQSSDLITVLDSDGRVTYQSPSIEHVLGWDPEDVIGTRFADLMAGDDARELESTISGLGSGGALRPLECALAHREGSERHFEILCSDLTTDENVAGVVLNSRDVSDRRRFEAELTHQAFHDPVTGLANRALFFERARHALANAKRSGHCLAVIFLDLDDFKTINDSLGHAAGDAVLAEVGRRMSTNIRTSDTAARFGGDEFAVLLENVAGVQEAADTAERIQQSLAEPYSGGQRTMTLSSSLGISMADSTSVAGADELIRDADAAMYIAKREANGGYRLFEPEMHERVLRRLELRADLQEALASCQLELHYQPVVLLADGSVSGVEALLRWHHPDRGMIAPDQFIPLAEETGLIISIGRWVLREGCRNAQRLFAAMPGRTPTLAINVSLRQLQDTDIVMDVHEALTESGMNPASLTLEITESVLADTELAVARLSELKALGVRLALDDFGTGYSSLSYLSRFPIDVLKMDRSFLRDDVKRTTDLTPAVLAIGRTLGIEVVAEGIELAEQTTRLRDLGCAHGQGFFFARPMDVDATLDFLSGCAALSPR